MVGIRRHQGRSGKGETMWQDAASQCGMVTRGRGRGGDQKKGKGKWGDSSIVVGTLKLMVMIELMEWQKMKKGEGTKGIRWLWPSL